MGAKSGRPVRRAHRRSKPQEPAPNNDRRAMQAPAIQSSAPTLLSAPQVAAWLGMTLARVYELSRLNRLPGAVRFGRTLRYDRVRLEQFIATGGAALDGGWRHEAD